MKSKNIRIAALGISMVPFFIAGWFFTGWLSDKSIDAPPRAELIIVDPPAELDQVAQNLGFWVTSRDSGANIDRISISLRVPRGLSQKMAVSMLRREIPGLRFEIQQRSK